VNTNIFSTNSENAVNTNTARDAQNNANTSVFEGKTKNIVNCSICGGLITQNVGIYTVFATFFCFDERQISKNVSET